MDHVAGRAFAASARCSQRSARTKQRARFIGYPVLRYKLAAFVISATSRAWREPAGLPQAVRFRGSRCTSTSPGKSAAMTIFGGDRQFPRADARRAFLHPVPRGADRLHVVMAVLVRAALHGFHPVFSRGPDRRRRSASLAPFRKQREDLAAMAASAQPAARVRRCLISCAGRCAPTGRGDPLRCASVVKHFDDFTAVERRGICSYRHARCMR